MKVICDTNIWYEIASGSISPQIFEGYELVATRINIDELTTSPNLLDKLKLVQGALRSIVDYSSFIIAEPPMVYFLRSLLPDGHGYDKLSDEEIKSLEILMNRHHEDFEIDRPTLENEINRYRSVLHESAGLVNELLLNIRTNIKNTTGKNAHRNLNTIDKTIRLLQWISEKGNLLQKDQININWEGFSFEEFDLLIHTLDSYFKELEVSNRKFTRNDWIDLFNLVYCGPDEKYWTLENKWINLIGSNSKTSEYLFKIN